MGNVHPAKPSPHASALFMGRSSEPQRRTSGQDRQGYVAEGLSQVEGPWHRGLVGTSCRVITIVKTSIKNNISMADLKRAIEEAMPSRKVVKWRKRIEPIKNEWRLCQYIVKAKVRGHNKQGVMVEDLYRHKRLLFVAKLQFKKVGTIGDFWEQGKNKKKFWDEIKAIEQRIGEGLDKPNVKRLCKHVFDFLGDFVPLKKIERSYGYDADGKAVQDWIETLLTTEWADDKDG